MDFHYYHFWLCYAYLHIFIHPNAIGFYRVLICAGTHTSTLYHSCPNRIFLLFFIIIFGVLVPFFSWLCAE